MTEEAWLNDSTTALTDSGARTFVWSIWAFMLVAALGFVHTYSSNVPYVDDWALVPYLTRNLPVTRQALWMQHNEHRLPIPKLALLVLLRVTKDFRAGMYCTVLILGALAFAMIHVAKSIRGQTSYTDAFFPLLLLNWGHCENFLWGWQIQFGLFNLFLGTVFLLLVWKRGRFTARNGILAGLCLGLATYCGGQSLPFVVLLAGWLIVLGIHQLLVSPAGLKFHGGVVLGMGAATLAAVGVIFIGLKHNPGDYFAEPNPTFGSILKTSLEVLIMSLGAAAGHGYTENFLWPFSWLFLAGLLLVATGHLLVVLCLRSTERFRALGLLLFLGAVASLALAIGWARASDQSPVNGLANRYVTLMIPALYCPYFVFTLYTPLKWRSFAEISLFTIFCSLALFNTYKGIEYARKRSGWDHAFLADMAAGEPIYKLVSRYHHYSTYELEQEPFAGCLRMLHTAKFRAFRGLQEDPAFQEIPIPLNPSEVNNISWQENTGRVTSPGGYLLFTLPKPKYIAGIRLNIRYVDRKSKDLAYPQATGGMASTNPAGIVLPWTRKALLIEGGLPRFQVSWKTPKQKLFTETDWGDNLLPRWQDERYLAPGDQEQTVTVWIADTITGFRIYPDKPLVSVNQTQPGSDRTGFQAFNFMISNIELLVENPEKDP